MHRKIKNFPTPVVLWSPTIVLLTCRAIKEEATSAVNNTVMSYKYARDKCSFGPALSYDVMARIIVEWTPEGPRLLDSISALFKAVMDCKRHMAATGKLFDHHGTTLMKSSGCQTQVRATIPSSEYSESLFGKRRSRASGLRA